MTRLEDLLVSVLSRLPTGVGDAEAGLEVVPTEVEMDLPIEGQVAAGGVLLASLPRGRMETGFQIPLSRLRARLSLEEAK